jgi:hypothetical protein
MSFKLPPISHFTKQGVFYLLLLQAILITIASVVTVDGGEEKIEGVIIVDREQSDNSQTSGSIVWFAQKNEFSDTTIAATLFNKQKQELGSYELRVKSEGSTYILETSVITPPNLPSLNTDDLLLFEIVITKPKRSFFSMLFDF